MDVSRRAVEQAAQWFVDSVALVPSDRWNGPGLGVWNVRELVGHTSRGLITIEQYCATRADKADVADSTEYYERSLKAPYVNVEAQAKAIAQRGRDTAKVLCGDPVAAVRKFQIAALTKLAATPDDAILTTPLGGMRIGDYLPTRILELTVHTLDLCQAVGLEQKAPKDALAVTLRLLADLSMRLGEGEGVAMALTGRQPLPAAFCLL